jgi:hypothetical protein
MQLINLVDRVQWAQVQSPSQPTAYSKSNFFRVIPSAYVSYFEFR